MHFQTTDTHILEPIQAILNKNCLLLNLLISIKASSKA